VPIALALGALLAIGCGKKHGDASPEPGASASEPGEEHEAHEASSSASASESAGHAASASTHVEVGGADAGAEGDGGRAASSTSGSGGAVVVGTGPDASGVATHAPSASASIAAASCGEKGQPKCPLQGWMSTVVQPALASKEASKLAAALRQCAKYAPPGFPEWAKIANEGATAVDRASNVTAGKKSCTDCHNLYKAKYKAEARTRPL
jgi:hypothetical protein